MTATVLIFPASYGDGSEHRRRAELLGLKVVGASSVANDPVAGDYAAWAELPHVTDPGFDAALAALIARHGVDQIHASHYVAWKHLEAALPALAPGVRLTLGRTFVDLERDYAEMHHKMATPPAIRGLDQASEPREALLPEETAGFIRAAMSIPGESYEAKLRAFIEVARRCPAGDIVEVGCLFGRSASLLAMLSRRYGLGHVLCVDPWSSEQIDQGDATLAEASKVYDWSVWRLMFEINVIPFGQGRLNYLHMPSVEGAGAYAANRAAETATFGRTTYAGEIAFLHIDGNHDYSHALADAQAWIPHMAAGGWIVFDDYDWDWGDGPKRVADAWIVDNAPRVRTHFVVGGAMFIQLR